MQQWEYKSVPVTIYRTGEFHLRDLDVHKQVFQDAGWEYIDMRALPTDDPSKAEVILRFRRPKPPKVTAVVTEQSGASSKEGS
jgi:hypothetical protein